MTFAGAKFIKMSNEQQQKKASQQEFISSFGSGAKVDREAERRACGGAECARTRVRFNVGLRAFIHHQRHYVRRSIRHQSRLTRPRRRSERPSSQTSFCETDLSSIQTATCSDLNANENNSQHAEQQINGYYKGGGRTGCWFDNFCLGPKIFPP